MSNSNIAVRWMCDNNYGSSLHTDGAIINILHDEFKSLRNSNEHMLSDYDMLDMCHEFGVHDMNFMEKCIGDACIGQCLAGVEMEASLRNSVAYLHEQGNTEMANMAESSIGCLYYYESAFLSSVKRILGDRVTEISVRRFLRFIMGHERQHTQQSMEFIQQGRTINDTKLLCSDSTNIDLNAAIRYSLIPSEMEADAEGFVFMSSLEQE